MLLARPEPPEPLLEHLEGVARLAERWAPAELKAEARLAGLAHDLYKATPLFQDYLKNPALKAKIGQTRLQHAWPSALFAAYLAAEAGLDATAVFLAVARHHGHLKTPGELLPSPKSPEILKSGAANPYRAAAEQTRAIAEDPSARELLAALGWEAAFLRYAELGPEAWAQQLRRRLRSGDYWRATRLFSLLIDADKRLAAAARVPPRHSLPTDAAKAYLARVKARREPAPLDPFRDRLFAHVDAAAELPLDALFPAALTLSAPTGAGKTLALLNFALKLRRRLEEAGRGRPRIVYALPYVNLIEQNKAVFTRALKAVNADPEAVLLAHHHLSELGGEDELKSVEEALLLAEAWEAEVIVTTFVQVVETLFGTRNRMLKKLHRLTGGTILILDEVQALPLEHWPLIRRLLADFVALGNTVLLATATQPRLVQGTRELAPPFPDYPARVELRWAEGLPETPAERPRLIVQNSLRRSLAAYAQQKALGGEVCYLSTNLTPRDRAIRLWLLRNRLKKGLPVTLVATPIIEAGLDLDFHEGWRDLGPVDSVVQVMGRINRAAHRPTETLYLLDDEGSLARVYGGALADAARSFFDQHLTDALTDLELTRLLPSYFEDLEARISQARARGFLDALTRLRFCRRGYPERCGDCRERPEACDVCCFSLIEEGIGRVPIFIEQSRGASRVLARLGEALKEQDANRRRTALRRLRPALARYTINPIVPLAAKNLPAEPLFGHEDYRLVPKDQLEAYYDPETGFKWEASFEDQFL